MRASSLTIALLTLVAIPSFPASGLAGKLRVCQEQEQRYEQIRSQAGPIERNIALSSAADKGCASLAQRLLADGASLASRDRQGASPLTHAAKAGDVALLDYFIAHGADINARDLNGSTPLFVAAEQDNPQIVSKLIEHGADSKIPGRSGLSPLAAAAYMGNVSTVKILLSKGADPKLQDATGKTAICYAAARGYSSIVRELLDTSIGVNTRYGNLLTVLMWAAGHDDGTGSSDVEDVLTLLLARGADLNLQDNRGRTALMIAASLGHRKAIDILLSHGADKNLRDKSGKSAEDLASSDDVRQQIAAR